MPWTESPECWVPSRGETREHAQRISVSTEVEDPRLAASLAAQKYAERDFRTYDPFTHLEVRVATTRVTFDVYVDVIAEPEFIAQCPVQIDRKPSP